MKKPFLLLGILCAFFLSYSANNALDFDGYDDNVNVQTQPLYGLNSFTIDGRFYNLNNNGAIFIFFQFHDNTNGRFEVRCDDGYFSLYSERLANKLVSTTLVPFKKEFHLVLIKNNSTTSLYVDDQLVLTMSGNFTIGQNLRIGRYFATEFYTYYGKMDEIRFWNSALSTKIVNSYPTCGLSGSEPGLVAYWPFDDGVPNGINTGMTTTNDLSPSNKDGLLENFALKGTISNFVPSSLGCIVPNNALELDGIDDNMVLSPHPLYGVDDFTIEAWMMCKRSVPDFVTLFQFNDSQNQRFEVRIDKDQFSMFSESLFFLNYSSMKVPLNKYFHLVIVKDFLETTLYIDGVKATTITGDYSLGSSMRLGRYFSSVDYSFKGQVDEVRFWNSAKTLAQLNAYPLCGLTGSEAGLVGYWPFNEGVAGGNNTTLTTANDLSVSNKDGVLDGFARNDTVSNFVTSKINCTVVVTEASDVKQDAAAVQVFPNPAKDWVELSGINGVARIQLFDMAGILLLEQSVEGKLRLPENLQPGAYIMTVNGSKSHKLILMKE